MGKVKQSARSSDAPAPSSDLDAWAEAERASKKPRCVTCQLPEPARKSIREFVERRTAGTLALSIGGLQRLLAATYGYTGQETTLYNHLRKCEGWQS